MTDTTSVALINPIRYRGYVYDTESGLYYLQSRYYDPTTCRFVNEDVYTDTQTGLVGTNMFAYCDNNAVMDVDPDGKDAYLIVNSDGAKGAGHVSLLVYANSHWNYIYCGGLIQISIIPNCDWNSWKYKLRGLNRYIKSNQPHSNGVETNGSDSEFEPLYGAGWNGDPKDGYNGYIYFKGDFTKSYYDAVSLENHGDNYSLSFHNCLDISLEILDYGSCGAKNFHKNLDHYINIEWQICVPNLVFNSLGNIYGDSWLTGTKW
ncbi:MAG: RHS repeat-associated core domain-containing protein [Bacillota bacterium]|nr:RHS repeat-associated core domain-containing protein [Bacillota bacterium]